MVLLVILLSNDFDMSVPEFTCRSNLLPTTPTLFVATVEFLRNDKQILSSSILAVK